MNSIERQALRLIGENLSSPDVFTDTDSGLAQIRGSINDAIQELSMVTGSYTREYRLTLMAERQWYRIQPIGDYLGYPIEVYDLTRGRKLDRTDPVALSAEDSEWLGRPGNPWAYLFVGSKYFGLYPVPSTSLLLLLKCVMIPMAYQTDKEQIKLKEVYHSAAVSLAVSEFYASRGDAARATEYLQRYLESAKLMQLDPTTADRQYQFGKYDPKGWRR